MKLRIGLIINPIAGLGGSVAMKGSDGADVQFEARRRGAVERADARAAAMLTPLVDCRADIELLTWAGAMGATATVAAGFMPRVMGGANAASTCAIDTQNATRALCSAGIDVLVFVGGDGTARDVLAALPATSIRQLVLGVPAGVKMHSSVFAVTPRAAAEVIQRLLVGGLVAVADGEVRDIDEPALRLGQLRNVFFGTLRVPVLGHHMQHLKQGGREIDALAQQEIAAALIEQFEPGICYLLGPGSTLLMVKQQLGLRAALLGVDVVKNGVQLLHDAGAPELQAMLANETSAVIVLSPTRGQGALLGRGNQQFSPAVIRAAHCQLRIVATRSKLLALDGRPLLIDTGDAALDQALCGLVEVLAGFEDRLLYNVATI